MGATHLENMDPNVIIWQLEAVSFITNSLTIIIQSSDQGNPAEMANGARDSIVLLCIKKVILHYGVTYVILNVMANMN